MTSCNYTKKNLVIKTNSNVMGYLNTNKIALCCSLRPLAHALVLPLTCSQIYSIADNVIIVVLIKPFTARNLRGICGKSHVIESDI